jgi:hypothetical protein
VLYYLQVNNLLNEVLNVARPKKASSDVRENRLTVYLTDEERDALENVAQLQERPMTQIVITAVKDWMGRLMNPPEALKQARIERIMKQDNETVRGYVCANGHPFWMEWVTPTGPRCCPVCGSEREIKRAWDGTVKKGI